MFAPLPSYLKMAEALPTPTTKCTFINFFGPNIAKADSGDEEMNLKATKDNSPV